MTLPMTRDVHPMTPNLPLTLIFTQQHIRKKCISKFISFFRVLYTVIYSIHVLLSIEILIKNSIDFHLGQNTVHEQPIQACCLLSFSGISVYGVFLVHFAAWKKIFHFS